MCKYVNLDIFLCTRAQVDFQHEVDTPTLFLAVPRLGGLGIEKVPEYTEVFTKPRMIGGIDRSAQSWKSVRLLSFGRPGIAPAPMKVQIPHRVCHRGSRIIPHIRATVPKAPVDLTVVNEAIVALYPLSQSIETWRPCIVDGRK